MSAAFIEHRPKSAEPTTDTPHFVIVLAGGLEVGNFKTQERAKNRACGKGFRPIQVARFRHRQERDHSGHSSVDLY